jgi:hypothetical protein
MEHKLVIARRSLIKGTMTAAAHDSANGRYSSRRRCGAT